MNQDEKYSSLKSISDRFIEILHDLYGLYYDALEGFQLYQSQMAKTAQDRYLIISKSPPTDPDAIIFHAALIRSIVERNDKEGSNYNNLRCSILAMVIEHWNHDIRKKLASIMGLKEANDLKSDIMGDINKIRNDFLHNRGKVDRSQSNVIIKFEAGEKIYISEDCFDSIIRNIFNYLNDLIKKETGMIAYSDHSLNQKIKKSHSSISHVIK